MALGVQSSFNASDPQSARESSDRLNENQGWASSHVQSGLDNSPDDLETCTEWKM